MKKIYSLIGAIAIFSAATAQTEVAKYKTGTYLTKKNVTFAQSSATEKTNLVAAGDTVMKTNDWLPLFQNANLSVYPTSWGFVYGYNSDSLNACAQYYNNTTAAQVTISKIAIMAVTGLSAPAAGNSYVKFNIAPGAPARAYNAADWNGAAAGSAPAQKSAPGPAVTASSTWSLTYATVYNSTTPFIVMTLTAPVTYTADFAVWADTRFLLGTDTVGFVSDGSGDGMTLEYALTRFAPGGSTVNYSWNTADAIWSSGGIAIDNNIAFFPIVDAVTATKEYVNGIKLNAIYPNPTKDLATIVYSLEKASDNVTLTVFDITGKKVLNETYGAQAAGEYKINLNASTLEAGSYFYQLNNGAGRITKEFVITK